MRLDHRLDGEAVGRRRARRLAEPSRRHPPHRRGQRRGLRRARPRRPRPRGRCRRRSTPPASRTAPPRPAPTGMPSLSLVSSATSAAACTTSTSPRQPRKRTFGGAAARVCSSSGPLAGDQEDVASGSSRATCEQSGRGALDAGEPADRRRRPGRSAGSPSSARASTRDGGRGDGDPGRHARRTAPARPMRAAEQVVADLRADRDDPVGRRASARSSSTTARVDRGGK